MLGVPGVGVMVGTVGPPMTMAVQPLKVMAATSASVSSVGLRAFMAFLFPAPLTTALVV